MVIQSGALHLWEQVWTTVMYGLVDGMLKLQVRFTLAIYFPCTHVTLASYDNKVRE